MLHLPKKLQFAIEAVLDVAIHAEAGPVKSLDIAHRAGIAARYLEAVLQQLVRAGILRGVRGPAGRYERSVRKSASAAMSVSRIRAKAGSTLPPVDYATAANSGWGAVWLGRILTVGLGNKFPLSPPSRNPTGYQEAREYRHHYLRDPSRIPDGDKEHRCQDNQLYCPLCQPKPG